MAVLSLGQALALATPLCSSRPLLSPPPSSSYSSAPVAARESRACVSGRNSYGGRAFQLGLGASSSPSPVASSSAPSAPSAASAGRDSWASVSGGGRSYGGRAFQLGLGAFSSFSPPSSSSAAAVAATGSWVFVSGRKGYGGRAFQLGLNASSSSALPFPFPLPSSSAPALARESWASVSGRRSYGGRARQLVLGTQFTGIPVPAAAEGISKNSGGKNHAAVRSKAALVQKVTASELDSILMNERTAAPLIIDFYATWCGPCVVLAQQLELLAVEYGKVVRFLKVDTDEEHELAAQMDIRGLPTMVFVSTDADKLAIRTEGLLPNTTIRDIIEKEILV